MPRSTIQLRNIAGTEAALGWAGVHTVVVDRPDGKAGGAGLGFNGAQLLGLALGGCFCNDLRYASHALGLPLGDISVSVELELDGDPLLVTAATVVAECRLQDGGDATAVVERARQACTIANSLSRGVPVAFR